MPKEKAGLSLELGHIRWGGAGKVGMAKILHTLRAILFLLERTFLRHYINYMLFCPHLENLASVSECLYFISTRMGFWLTAFVQKHWL